MNSAPEYADKYKCFFADSAHHHAPAAPGDAAAKEWRRRDLSSQNPPRRSRDGSAHHFRRLAASPHRDAQQHPQKPGASLTNTTLQIS